MGVGGLIVRIVPEPLKRPADRLFQKIKNVSNIRIYDRTKLHQLWEEHHLRRLLKHYDVDCVFDVGANMGQYAEMLRRVGYDGLIVSFEPIPEAAEAVRAAASIDPMWKVEEIAISSENGMQTFNVMESSQFSSLSTPRHDETDIFKGQNKITRSVQVRTETLDSTFRRLHATYGFKRPFLKMDTQGFDVQVVNSGRNVLQNFVGLQSELAVKKLYADSVDFRSAISVYESVGFELSAIVPNNAGHFPYLIETDCIMIRTGQSTSEH
jgi:FkbM family methyltransferase